MELRARGEIKRVVSHVRSNEKIQIELKRTGTRGEYERKSRRATREATKHKFYGSGLKKSRRYSSHVRSNKE